MALAQTSCPAGASARDTTGQVLRSRNPWVEDNQVGLLSNQGLGSPSDPIEAPEILKKYWPMVQSHGFYVVVRI